MFTFTGGNLCVELVSKFYPFLMFNAAELYNQMVKLSGSLNGFPSTEPQEGYSLPSPIYLSHDSNPATSNLNQSCPT